MRVVVLLAALGCASAGPRERRAEALLDLEDASRRETAGEVLAELDLLEDDPAAALERGAFTSGRGRLIRALAADALGDPALAVAELTALVDDAQRSDLGSEAAAPTPFGAPRVALHWLYDNAELVPAGWSPRARGRPASRLSARLARAPAPPFPACIGSVDSATPRVDTLRGRPMPAIACEPRTADRRDGLPLGNSGRGRYRAVLGPASEALWVELRLPTEVATLRVLPPRSADGGEERPTTRQLARRLAAGESLEVVGVADTAWAHVGLSVYAGEEDPIEAHAPPDDGPADWVQELAVALDAREDPAAFAVHVRALRESSPTLAAAAALVPGERSTLRHTAFRRSEADKARRDGRSSAARRLAEALSASRDPRDILLAAAILGELGLVDAARAALGRAQRHAPTSCAPARGRLELELDAVKLGGSLELPPGCEHEPRIAQLLAAVAADTQAIGSPGDEPLAAIRLLERRGDSAGALALAHRAVEQAPRDPKLWLALSGLLTLARDTVGADAAALALWHAASGELEPRLAALARGVGAELLALSGSVEAALAQAVPTELIVGRSAVVLLDHATTLRFQDGQGLHHIRQALRLLDSAAVEAYGEADVPANAVLLLAETRKPDGARLVPERIDEKESVSFPALEPGDAIVLEYLTPLVPDPFLGGGSIESPFAFDLFDVPVMESCYRVLAPRNRAPVVRAEGAQVAPLKLPDTPFFAPLAGQEACKRRSPGVSGEPEAAAPLAALSQTRTVCLGSSSAPCTDSPKAVAELLLEAALPLLQPDAALSALAATIRSAGDDKIGALWRAARALEVDEGAWLSVPASTALATGRGERAVLVWALALEAGLDAELVLARPVDGGATTLDRANPRHYSAQLVRIVDPSRARPWLLDPEFAMLAPGHVSPRVFGQPALRLGRADVTPWIVPRQSESAERTVRVELDLQRNGSLRGTWREVSRGADAMAWRSARTGLDKDKWRDAVASLLEPLLQGAELQRFKTEGLAGDGPVEAELRFTRGPREGLELTLFPIELANRWASLEARRSDLLLDVNVVMDLEIVVRGEGLSEAPPDVHLTWRPGGDSVGDGARGASYKRSVVHEGGSVRVRREVRIHPERIAPVDYPAFRTFALAVDQADVVTVARRSEADAASAGPGPLARPAGGR